MILLLVLVSVLMVFDRLIGQRGAGGGSTWEGGGHTSLDRSNFTLGRRLRN